MTELPDDLMEAIHKVLEAEPLLRLAKTKHYDHPPFSYAVLLAPKSPISEEEHADLSERVSNRIYDLLEDRSLDMHWSVAMTPVPRVA